MSVETVAENRRTWCLRGALTAGALRDVLEDEVATCKGYPERVPRSARVHIDVTDTETRITAVWSDEEREVEQRSWTDSHKLAAAEVTS